MRKISNNQDGVTLLLAILILAGLALVTLAIGSFAIQELRASRAVIISEPAIGAAESGAELGLWAIKRSGTLSTNCDNPTNPTTTNNTFINLCKSFDHAVFDLKGGTPFSFYLYDPDNINTDVDLLGYSYSWINIAQIAGSYQVAVTVQRLDGATTGISPSSTTVSPGGNEDILISPVAAGTEGRMKVTLTSSGNVTVDVNTDRGMPTFPTVDSTGCSSKTAVTSCDSGSQEIYTRRINVTVPQ